MPSVSADQIASFEEDGYLIIPGLFDAEEAGILRAAAQAEGFDCVDLGKAGVFDDIARLIVSPGIPHLYPAPNPVIVAAQDAAVPVDNDIGLFFQSFATLAWDNFDVVPKIIAITGSNGKSTTSALVDLTNSAPIK